MSFLSGLFGGHGDTSTQATTTNTSVTTNTTSTVGDIGVTGSDAVAIVNAGVGAGVAANQSTAQLFSDFGNALTANNNNFLTNATSLYDKALNFAGSVVNTGFSNVSNANQGALTQAYGDVAAARTGTANTSQAAFDLLSQSSGNVSQSLIKFGTYALIAVVAFQLLKGAR